MHRHTISFKNAAIGIYTAARTQANIRIHLIISTVVLIAGAYFKISIIEAVVLLLTIAMVIIAEMFNTSIEFLSDKVTKEHDELIKYTKDVSAGAVLVSAIFAAIIGSIIFIPKLF